MNKKNEEKNEIKESDIINKNKITENHLNNLDIFIQNCLDKFKFVDPKQELYEATGEDNNIIISHKSTIPDLVIWNKSFNKNNCFYESNNNQENKFPRMMFYIKINKKKSKKNNNSNNNKTNTNNESSYNEKNKIINKINNNDININKDIDIRNNFNYNNNNILNSNMSNINNNNIYNQINNIEYNNNNIRFNKAEDNNKFSMNKNQYFTNNNMNNINSLLNLTTYLIQLYLYKDGWIILNNDKFSGPGTSINLFQFLQEKLKENEALNEFIIIDINKKVNFSGNDFYILLSNILPKIFQKKQMELIKFEELMSKYFQNNANNNLNMSNNNNNNNNHININLYNNQIFPGINYIGNINNNISNANFIQNNITNLKYNIQQKPGINKQSEDVKK